MFGHLRTAIGALRRTPGFTAAALLTFTLGIGVNIAVLSIVDRMLFRPLPYGDADRLVHLHSFRSSRGPAPESFLPAIVTARLKATSTTLTNVAYAQGNRPLLALDGVDGPLKLDTASYNLLGVLGVTPIAGRDFTREDARARQTIILLSEEVWRRRFGRSADVFASAYTRNGAGSFRVVGILPRGFLVPASAFGERSDGLLLDSDDFERMSDAFEAGPSVVARLRDGAGIDRAQAEVNVLVAQLARDYPASVLARTPVTVQPLRSGLFFLQRPYAWLVIAAVSAVFMVSCVSLATLFLARGRSREQDLAIRAALGASRGRLVLGTLAEAGVLCVVSAGLALVACQWLFNAIVSIIPVGLRGIAIAPLDLRLIVIAICAALVSAVLAGGIPALRGSRIDIVAGLRRDRRSSAGRLRGGATLLAVEAAFAVLLVSGAAITVRSFLGLLLKNPGWEAAGLFEASIGHGFTKADGAYAPARLDGILDVVRGLPGVEAAGATAALPVGRSVSTRDAFWQKRGMEGRLVGISGGFFAALATPMVAGQEFADADVRGRALVAIVNESAARRLWHGRRTTDVVGEVVATNDGPRTIVGVAADLKPLPGLASAPSLFIPLTAPEVPPSSSSVIVAIRANGVTAFNAAALNAQLDARFGRGSARVTRVADALPPQLQRPRFQAMLFGTVAVIGLLLAAIGLYAVAAFEVARRRFELGVRLSLGASARDLRRLVIYDTLRPVVVGAAIGLLGTWWAAKFMQSFVFEVDARDPWTYVLVGLVLAATAVVAAWLPARRAARTDPTMALRGV